MSFGKPISQEVGMLIEFPGVDDPWELINPCCRATPITPSFVNCCALILRVHE
jgi:hypothetical protein